MKSLLLVRHAKSSWNFDVEDFERPLNERGKSDALVMAERLVKKEIKIDTIVSSPANRALSTAYHFAKVYNIKEKEIIILPELYEARINVFETTVNALSDEFKKVALFSHNPGITEYANSLTNVRLDEMPTCGIFAVKSAVKKWADFFDSKKEFWFFEYPKSL